MLAGGMPAPAVGIKMLAFVSILGMARLIRKLTRLAERLAVDHKSLARLAKPSIISSYNPHRLVYN